MVNESEKMENRRTAITTLSTVVIAFSTWVGVGAGLAYYVSQILKVSIGYLVFVEIIYLLLSGWVIQYVWSKVK